MNLTVKEVLDRYGPALAMIAAVVGLVIFIPGNDDSSGDEVVAGPVATEDTSDSTGEILDSGNAPLTQGGRLEGFPGGPDDGGGTTGGGGTTTGGGGATPAGGGTTGGSGETSTAGGGGSGGGATASSGPVWSLEHGPGNYPAPTASTECREDGAMPDFSQYSNPCLPLFDLDDNGGATAQGVTADTVKVVWYNNQEDPATQAALRGAGAGDTDEITRRDINALFRHYNLHRETYKREVVMVEFEGTGDPLDDNVLRADAVAIAQNEKPFAVFHHSFSMGSVFSEELAARGVICVCTGSAPRSLYTDYLPYLYTILPTVDFYYTHVAEYVGKRLNGTEPKYAGPVPPGRLNFNETRKFGLVFLEGSGADVNPRVRPVVDKFKQQLAQYGAKLEIDIAYQYDLAQAQAQSTNIIGQLVNAGVNNVIFVGDPLYPIFLTQAASQQRYNPEWLITGTGLIDTTFFGRTYNQEQWGRAFGISTLWVFAPLTEMNGTRSANHTDPEGDRGVGINVTVAPIQTIFSGIHTAGPILTPERFGEGLFNAPPVGGTLTAPLVKFTRAEPGALKDFVEVWWDVDRPGMDEQDRQGIGFLVKANAGARYQEGQWPTELPYAFDDDPAPITETDQAETFPHGDADGHRHDDDAVCRACGPTTHQ